MILSPTCLPCPIPSLHPLFLPPPRRNTLCPRQRSPPPRTQPLRMSRASSIPPPRTCTCAALLSAATRSTGAWRSRRATPGERRVERHSPTGKRRALRPQGVKGRNTPIVGSLIPEIESIGATNRIVALTTTGLTAETTLNGIELLRPIRGPSTRDIPRGASLIARRGRPLPLPRALPFLVLGQGHCPLLTCSRQSPLVLV